MENLNQRIERLEQQVQILLAKIRDLSFNVEEKTQGPYVVAGGTKSSATMMPIDAKTGKSPILASHVIWNDSESFRPPLNEEPDLPEKGYNKHSHSRFSGGALIKDVLEIVEYDWDSVSPTIINKHSQQFWTEQPMIAKCKNSEGNDVEKIGTLEMEFDPNTLTWKAGITEIDVEKVYLVRKDLEGNIMLDINGNEMKAVLLYTLADIGTKEGRNENLDKSNVWWDETARCWRFYAVFKPMPEE